MKESQYQKIKQLGFSSVDFFKNDFDLLNQLVKKESTSSWDISEEIKSIESLYKKLQLKATDVDKSLDEHVISLEIKSGKKLAELEKKMMRSERNKFEASKRQIKSIKSDLFPNNSLQERVFNFSDFYSRMGKSFIQLIYDASPALEMNFTIIVIK
jgi:uncharacterized protein YllA (UPF0747 family)